MHLLGNTKGDTGGAVFTGQSTIPDVPFSSKTMKAEFLTDLRKVMSVVSEHLYQRSWKKCETTLEKVTSDPSKVRTSDRGKDVKDEEEIRAGATKKTYQCGDRVTVLGLVCEKMTKRMRLPR